MPRHLTQLRCYLIHRIDSQAELIENNYRHALDTGHDFTDADHLDIAHQHGTIEGLNEVLAYIEDKLKTPVTRARAYMREINIPGIDTIDQAEEYINQLMEEQL